MGAATWGVEAELWLFGGNGRDKDGLIGRLDMSLYMYELALRQRVGVPIDVGVCLPFFEGRGCRLLVAAYGCVSLCFHACRSNLPDCAAPTPRPPERLVGVRH